MYKQAYEPAVACSIIFEESGKHFDPAIIAVFEACFDEFVRVGELMGDDAEVDLVSTEMLPGGTFAIKVPQKTDPDVIAVVGEA